MQETHVMPSIEKDIRQFIVDNFLFGDSERTPARDDSLLEQGIVDSTGILEMVAFLENRYDIEIHEDELVAANLDSLNKLVDFVGRKTALAT
jgi:acyl carrier protein